MTDGYHLQVMRPLFLQPALAIVTLASVALGQGVPPKPQPNPQGNFPSRTRTVGSMELPRALPTAERLQAIEIPPQILQRIEALDDDAWTVREVASRGLLVPAVDDNVLLAALSQLELTTEQRARLVRIAVRRVLDAPRGALGIRMRRGAMREGGVTVEALIQGMPAADVLEVGDRVTAIDGTVIQTSEDLTWVVQSKLPGDEIVVDVSRRLPERNGQLQVDADGRPLTEELRLRFALGSVAQLDPQGGVSDSMRVLNRRNEFAVQIRIRFGLRGLPIRTPNLRAAESGYLTRSPDTHESVRWLLRRLELIELGLAALDVDARREVRNRLSELMLMAEDPLRSEQERAWIERVTERYIELAPSE